MRKTTKTIMAFLTAMTMTAGAMGVTAFAEETPTEAIVSSAPESVLTEGVFSEGATYQFIKGSDALIIDGDGSFTVDEFDYAVKQFDPRAIVFGKNVSIPESDVNYEWLRNILDFSQPYSVFTNWNSKIYYERKNMITELSEKDGTNKVALSQLYHLCIITNYEPIEDYVSMYSYEQCVLDKEEEFTNYLLDNGIDERIARKFVGCYLTGLNRRVRNTIEGADPEFPFYDKANVDGTELNEKTLRRIKSILLRGAQAEQDLLSGVDPKNYKNDAAKYLLDNGVSINDCYLLTLSYAAGGGECLAGDIFLVQHDDNKDSTIQVNTEAATEVEATEANEQVEKAPETINETTKNTVSTLKGDVDLNGEVGIADVVKVSKNNINEADYPLENEIAQANADMNNDNVIDGLDTAALIEINLGNKK